VDDTIHFLTHYRTEVVQHGDLKRAVIQSFRETGQAITFTSIILSLGFLIFLFSSHNGLSNFGVMSAVAFFVAVLADLFLLPSLCLLTGLRFGQEPEPVRAGHTREPIV
jgi:predicted RND superfamily exporter protein